LKTRVSTVRSVYIIVFEFLKTIQTRFIVNTRGANILKTLRVYRRFKPSRRNTVRVQNDMSTILPGRREGGDFFKRRARI